MNEADANHPEPALWRHAGELDAFAVAAIVMILTGGVAAYVPARRAARVDPIVGLREG
jgi:ABC-type lipoprotein release transport system permease subunit